MSAAGIAGMAFVLVLVVHFVDADGFCNSRDHSR